jgi:RND family efflux transporter MFP subunit
VPHTPIPILTPASAPVSRRPPPANWLVWLPLAAIGFGCGRQLPPVPTASPPAVTFVTAQSETTRDYDEYTGWTAASQTVEVRSRVYGYLKSVAFNDGDDIQAGDLLYEIEPDDYQAAHDQSLARIEVSNSRATTARAKLARFEALKPTGAISQEEYEEAVAAVKEAEAVIIASRADAARTALDLKYTQLLSPISGQIDRTQVTPGNLVTGGMTSGTLLTTIVSTQPLHVYFDVDEASLLRYRRLRSDNGQPVPITAIRQLDIDCLLQLGDESDFPHAGKLDFAETSISQTSGTITLRAVFENRDRELPAGAFVRVRIPVSPTYTATTIPEAAIGTDQSIKYAYVIDDQNIARRRQLRLGSLLGDRRLILEGIQPGERVVLGGLLRVRPDSPVEPRPERLSSDVATPTPTAG